MTYVDIVMKLFPGYIMIQVLNSGSCYEDIVWNEFITPPTKTECDAAVTQYLSEQGNIITKFQFRKLFTLTERIGLDNFQSNQNIPAEYKAVLTTMFKDLDASGAVNLTLPDVIQGVGMLEQLGLIASGRATQILSRQAPA